MEAPVLRKSNHKILRDSDYGKYECIWASPVVQLRKNKSTKKFYDMFNGSPLITYRHTDKYGQVLTMERTISFPNTATCQTTRHNTSEVYSLQVSQL